MSNPSPPGLKYCLELAKVNAANPFPPNHWEPQTLVHQTEAAKQYAISAWQARGHNAHSHTGLPYPPGPPDGELAPVIRGTSGGSRQAATTVVRLVTGHAFVSSYTARFYPHKRTSCPGCGVNGQPPIHRTRHQTLPALRKSLSRPPPPSTPDLCQPSSALERQQGTPNVPVSGQGLLQAARGSTRPRIIPLGL